MKNMNLLVILMSASGVLAACEKEETPIVNVNSEYNSSFNQLLWSEEFNYEGAPDPSKWSYEEGFVRNNEDQYYTKDRRENVRVENGCLVIEAHKEPWQGMNYTSGSIQTNGKFIFSGGRIEVRAKVPSGRGTWPAIWTLGSGFPKTTGHPECGEIDILEYVGYNPDRFWFNAHTPGTYFIDAQLHGTSVSNVAASEEFHVFALEWYEDHLKWFVDETCVYEFHKDVHDESLWRFDYSNPQFLLLNLAIGGSWGGNEGINDSLFPVQYYVDYVRYYGTDKMSLLAVPDLVTVEDSEPMTKNLTGGTVLLHETFGKEQAGKGISLNTYSNLDNPQAICSKGNKALVSTIAETFHQGNVLVLSSYGKYPEEVIVNIPSSSGNNLYLSFDARVSYDFYGLPVSLLTVKADGVPIKIPDNWTLASMIFKNIVIPIPVNTKQVSISYDATLYADVTIDDLQIINL
jgi:beta-glucanase (GH16 family)